MSHRRLSAQSAAQRFLASRQRADEPCSECPRPRRLPGKTCSATCAAQRRKRVAALRYLDDEQTERFRLLEIDP